MKIKFKNIFSKFKFNKVKEISSKSTNFVNLLGDKYLDTNDEYRRNTKITQVFVFSFVLMLIVNVMLIILLLSLIPFKEKVPYFVHFLPKDEQIVVVEPYTTNTKELRRIKEWIARDYVKKRETIDLASEELRYKEVLFMSDANVKNEFINEYTWDKNVNSPFKLAVENNYTRTITIISSSIINDNTIQVKFEAIQAGKAKGDIQLTQIVIATLSFGRDETNYKGNDYLNNPFGYVIADYSLGIEEYRDNKKSSNSFVSQKSQIKDTTKKRGF